MTDLPFFISCGMIYFHCLLLKHIMTLLAITIKVICEIDAHFSLYLFYYSSSTFSKKLFFAGTPSTFVLYISFQEIPLPLQNDRIVCLYCKSIRFYRTFLKCFYVFLLLQDVCLYFFIPFLTFPYAVYQNVSYTWIYRGKSRFYASS